MQVKCSRCSQPLALTDVIESSDGQLSHMDCKRPQTLTAEERALVFLYCAGHDVARCLGCDRSFPFAQLGADLLAGSTNLCPRCRKDLTESVRGHLFGCEMLPAEVRNRAQEVRDAAQRLVKESRQLRGRAHLLIRGAEANLLGRQEALRTAMAKRGAA